MHFARGAITSPSLISLRLHEKTYHQANQLPSHRRTRFLASRTLLAELLFMLYGITPLPDIALSPSGRPYFSDTTLPDFSISYAGNMVGVLLVAEGRCGLDMRLQGNFAPFSLEATPPAYSSNERVWVNNQLDPNEALSQLSALRQSILKLTERPGISLQLLPISGRLKIDNVPHIEAVSDVEDILVWGCATTLGIEDLQVWAFDHHHSWQRLTDMHTRSQRPGSQTIRLTRMGSETSISSHPFAK